jgi:hypothetical protein
LSSAGIRLLAHADLKIASYRPSTTPTRCDLLQTSDQLQLSERKPTSTVRDLGSMSSPSTTHNIQGRFFPFHSSIFDLICLQLDLIYSRSVALLQLATIRGPMTSSAAEFFLHHHEIGVSTNSLDACGSGFGVTRKLGVPSFFHI